MRSALILSSVALACLVKATSPVFADDSKCGPAPPFSGSAEKSQLRTEAAALSTLVGKAGLAKRVKAARDSLYLSFDNVIATQSATYLGYLFCSNIMRDNTLDMRDKLQSLQIFRSEIEGITNREIGDSSDILSIVDTGYDYLYSLNSERTGFGLYTYALITPGNSDRAYAFINTITTFTPHVSEFSDDDTNKINAIYIPTFRQSDANKFEDKYNFELSRRILLLICLIHSEDISHICKGSLSDGPYLFTYARPIDKTKQLSPPILFVDLSNVHQQAFATFLDAYKQQIKREDITDGAKINSLSIKILSITLTARDWMPSIERAVADIVHLISR
jgi:hypothetical protein